MLRIREQPGYLVTGNRNQQPVTMKNGIKSEDVFQPKWIDTLETMKTYEVQCDDKGRNGGSWLRVLIAQDGDVHVAMQEWEDIPKGQPDPFPSIRIRTFGGGGRNLKTRQALLWLAEAIRQDQLDNGIQP